MAIRVFTDSGADCPPKMAAELGIAIVPLSIHFGDCVYKDGVDLSTADFYRLLTENATPPNTSQPSPGEFLAAYQKHSNPGDTIMSFHMSSKFSGTYQSALIAARELTDREVHVMDTRSASAGILLPAIYATRWAAEGCTPDEVLQRCRKMIAGTHVHFLVSTLEYLHRHGRIGKAQAVLGSILDIKPVLCIDDGVVAVADKVRSMKHAVSRLLELSFGHIKPGASYAVGVASAGSAEIAAQIDARVRERLPASEILHTTLGPTLGTHVGPGAVGLVLAELPC